MEDDCITIRFKAVTTFNEDTASNITNVKLTRLLEGEWWWIIAEAWRLDGGLSCLETAFFKTLNNIGCGDDDLSPLEETKEEAITCATCHRSVYIELEGLVATVWIISLRGIEASLQDIGYSSASNLLEVVINPWEEG